MADTVVINTDEGKVTDEMIEEVVTELVGEDAVPIVNFLEGKSSVSEFIVAEELDMEIHEARKLLYKLLEENLVYFKRKKDKVKGWYICYWDLNTEAFPHEAEKIRADRIEELKERLQNEKETTYYMCNNACMRLSFEKAMELDFKCPECGEIMEEKDNERTVEFLKEKINDLESAA